ncbi:MAG: peptidylprolyl isomerase [Panacagrimonas sp.]|jgi:FKBP-type peptidyl-prolyl cis-trans isomerase SlyD|nr:peptidylprolyl isomerase [Panacagrimonas sp.]MCC2658834.1 peptidylprolyl isomerase [Panacagrimonas sp.]
MQIAERSVVSIHYKLTNDAGETLDSSEGGEPLVYLQGFGNLIPGLEKALVGKQAGDRLNVRVEPSEGYGDHDPKLIQQVPRRAFQGVSDVKAGMRFQAQGPNGPSSVVITRVAGDMVTVDGNHPLAGQHLNFAVEITDVRAASEEELAHGHVHGPGGHHH